MSSNVFGVLNNLEPKVEEMIAKCKTLPGKFPLEFHRTGVIRRDNENHINEYEESVYNKLISLETIKINIDKYISTIESCLPKLDKKYKKWDDYKEKLERAKYKVECNIEYYKKERQNL